MATGYATVKGVLTGDTLLLMGRSASNGPPPELQLTLSGVNAPRLARGSGTRHRRPGDAVYTRKDPAPPSQVPRTSPSRGPRATTSASTASAGP